MSLCCQVINNRSVHRLAFKNQHPTCVPISSAGLFRPPAPRSLRSTRVPKGCGTGSLPKARPFPFHAFGF